MQFDIDQIGSANAYKLMSSTVLPRPIAWVVTLNDDGSTNAAPFSFFNCFSGAPPVIGIGIGPHPDRWKDTLSNIEARGEFVVNMVSDTLAEAMNITAIDFPAGWNELETAGLETLASARIGVPRIARSPVAYECRLQQVVDIQSTNRLVLGNVVAVHVDDAAVLDPQRCHIDSLKLNLIGRTQSPGGYVRITDTFNMPMRRFADWERDAASG
ncbi:MAG: flavin reductase family protein [Burkholderiaceae bacterium]|nr:flavin reductase family protein [Burkholderiaceae bacterium]